MRSPENSPAQSALCFAIDAIIFAQVINKNLKLHDIKLSKYEDV